MSKQHKIKWREADLQELNRVVKNFNAKLRRLEKKNPENAKYLPKFSKTVYDEDIGDDVIVFTDRLSVNQLKDLINTRQDFNREINALKRFSRRGAEQLVQIKTTTDEDGNTVKLDNNIYTTKWQLAEMKRRLGRINKLREERLELIKKQKVRGGTGYTVEQMGMGDQLEHEFSPFKIASKTMQQSHMNWKFRSIFKESQSNYFTESDEALRDNYIWSLQTNYYGDDINELIDKIKGMDIGDFLKIFYKNPGIFEFSYHDNEQYKSYLDEIHEIWHKTDGPYTVIADGEPKVILDSFTDAMDTIDDYKRNGSKKVSMIDKDGKKVKL